MTGSLIGSIILWLIVAIIAIVVVVYLLNWLYHRSTKEVAFVRTGFGGEKVVINGGALVLPIVHEVTPVNLNVVRIPISRVRDSAVITGDRVRVDIEAEFFVRVLQQREAVAAAASTLGRRTLEAERLAELLTGKFVGALRSVAAERSLDEMHERRGDFVAAVEERAAMALAQNGLELESVAITDLDQTNLEFFNPSNRFDAEGLTRLIETIETRRKLRNDIEQSSMVAIRSQNLEAEKQTLKLEQESEDARLNQQRALEILRADQRAEVTRIQAARESEAEQARIASQQETRGFEIERRRTLEETEIRAQEEVERARIAQEQTLESARIERERQVRQEQIRQRHDLENAEIAANEELERARIASQRQLREAQILADAETEARDISRNQQTETARIEAQKEVEAARIVQDQTLDKARIERDRLLQAQQIDQRRSVEEAEIAAREEIERSRILSDRGIEEARIVQQREIRRLEVEREMTVELAEIERQIEILKKNSEEAEARIATESVRAGAAEAEEKVATVRETEVAERIAAIDRIIAGKDADMAKIAAEADRVTAEVAADADRLRNEAENVLTEDARAARLRARLLDRLEGIIRESVRPMENIEGIKILHIDGLAGSGGGSGRSPTDEVVESVLRYRVQSPLIDEMMKEIGIENANVARLGDVFRSARDAASLASDAEKKKDGDG
ncbi:MAG: SPFH domain-containing protein [Defluviicoccus sp.]|nr:SPFH domain-containing protein [Defluviicoccus sp.]